MRRDATPCAPSTECAPTSGGGEPRRARSGRRPAGMPLPSGRLTALFVFGVLGPIWLWDDEAGPEPTRMRLVPGEPGMMTRRFALSPDGKSIATAQYDGRVSIRSIQDERVRVRPLDRRVEALALAFSPDGRSLAVGREEPGILVFDLAS